MKKIPVIIVIIKNFISMKFFFLCQISSHFMASHRHPTPGSHFRYIFPVISSRHVRQWSFAAIGTQWTSMLSSESLGTGNSQWVVVDYNRLGWEVCQESRWVEGFLKEDGLSIEALKKPI